MGKDAARKIVTVIDLLEDYGLQISTSFVKHIEGKIWEVKVDRNRVLYFAFTGRKFIMLRAFAKRTEKTPAKEIRIARHRLEDYIARMTEER